jgi:hypothetical protein
MEKKSNRRTSKRHPAQWKVAIVLTDEEGRPIIQHTQTVDLSLGGAAIISEESGLTGKVITLLLGQPPRRDDERPKVIKAYARVVSSRNAKPGPGYHLGLNFVSQPGDELDTLAALIGEIEAAEPMPAPTPAPKAVSAAPAPATPVTRAPAVAAPPAAAPTAPATAAPAVPTESITANTRLARLRELAQAKLTEQKEEVNRDEIIIRVSAGLEAAYRYLKETFEQLNVVKPAYDNSYKIMGVPGFAGLKWNVGSAAFHTREMLPGKQMFERVAVNFKLTGDKPVQVSVESPGNEKLKRLLGEYKIEFNAKDALNSKGFVERSTFTFPCEVKGSILMVANFDTGRIQMRMINIERFGTLDHPVNPASINEEALDELAGFILCEERELRLLLRDA